MKLKKTHTQEEAEQRLASDYSELLGMSLRALFEKKYEEVMGFREKYIEAFIAETGLRPTECEIVEERGVDTITFYVRKRT